MKLAAAWTKRFASRREVCHFLAWLPDLRNSKSVKSLTRRGLSSLFKREHF
jgi:hypothetical protein